MEMINIQLTVDQLNIVVAGLGELPAKKSYDLIVYLQAEFNKFSEQKKLENDGDKNG